MNKKANVSVGSCPDDLNDLQGALGRLESVHLLDHAGNFVADLTRLVSNFKVTVPVLHEMGLGWTEPTTEYDTAVAIATETDDVASLTAADVLAAIELLRKRPFVVALWFVDRPNDYGRFSAARETKKDELHELGQAIPCEIPVHNWLSSHMEMGDVIAPFGGATVVVGNGRIWPWICQWPGIWLEMSDGQWRLYWSKQ